MTWLLRWGIITAGKISTDFTIALSTLPLDEHEIIAVAARDKARAESFAERHCIKRAYSNYADIAKHEDIDVVYIGAWSPQHFEIAMMMLEHGKSVLCEKPLCLSYKQTSTLIKYAEEKKLFLMEGVWSRFFPSYQYLRKQIEAGNLGDIENVDVSFGVPLEEVYRLRKNPGDGVVWDLGIYPIQCAQWAFQEPPLKIVAQGELNSQGIDVEVKATLHYSGGRVANLNLSARDQLENKAIIKGTKGQITLPNFWSPTKLIDVDGSEKEWVLPKGKYATNYPNSEGLRYQAEGVRQSLMDKKIQNDNVSHNDSLLFAQIGDEIRKQLGAVYNEDKA